MRPSEREYVDDEIIPAARCSHTSQVTEECPRMQTIFWKHSTELFRQKHITDDTVSLEQTTVHSSRALAVKVWLDGRPLSFVALL